MDKGDQTLVLVFLWLLQAEINRYLWGLLNGAKGLVESVCYVRGGRVLLISKTLLQ